MDDAGYVADRYGLLNECVARLARGDINDSNAHLEPSVTENFRGHADVILAQISQQAVLPALTRRAIA